MRAWCSNKIEGRFLPLSTIPSNIFQKESYKRTNKNKKKEKQRKKNIFKNEAYEHHTHVNVFTREHCEIKDWTQEGVHKM